MVYVTYFTVVSNRENNNIIYRKILHYKLCDDTVCALQLSYIIYYDISSYLSYRDYTHDYHTVPSYNHVVAAISYL